MSPLHCEGSFLHLVPQLLPMEKGGKASKRCKFADFRFGVHSLSFCEAGLSLEPTALCPDLYSSNSCGESLKNVSKLTVLGND